MGLPTRRIPEHMLQDFATILEATGAAVTTESLSDQNASQGVVSAYACAAPPDALVRVYLMRAQQHSTATGFTAVLQPVSSSTSSWKVGPSMQLLRQIDEALRRHGATDIEICEQRPATFNSLEASPQAGGSTGTRQETDAAASFGGEDVP